MQMKSYAQNLKALFISYIIVNLTIAILSFIIMMIIQTPILNGKMALFLSAIVSVGVLIPFILGRKTYQRKLDSLKTMTFNDKLNVYLMINKKLLNNYSIITVVSSMGLILNSNYMYLLFAVLAIALMILSMPNRPRLKFELHIKDEEVDTLYEKR